MGCLRAFTLSGAVLLLSVLFLLEAVNSEELASAGGEDGTSVGCGNCGEECKLKCGTRQFRLCCTHFFRKRSLEQPKTHWIFQAGLGNGGASAGGSGSSALMERNFPYWISRSPFAPRLTSLPQEMTAAGVVPRYSYSTSAESDLFY